MCFAPQRRALFRHLNFQKWSETVGFWHFWLGNVLRATTACTFATSGRQKVVRTCGVFYHSDLEMCFVPQRRAIFISHLASWLCTRRFSEVTFRPSGATNHWKTVSQWVATSLPFRAPVSSFFWLSPSLIFSLLDFSSLTLPTSAFPSLHIVGSLTSKLPSAIHRYGYIQNRRNIIINYLFHIWGDGKHPQLLANLMWKSMLSRDAGRPRPDVSDERGAGWRRGRPWMELDTTVVCTE